MLESTITLERTAGRAKAPPPARPNFCEHDARINYFVKGASSQNFGDYLPVLLSRQLMLHPRIEADIYRLIGSVIETSWILRDLRHTVGSQRGRIAFWCCGMRQSAALPPHVKALCSFFGARGPLTRDLLKLPKNTVLGDPGLLAPLLHEPSVIPALSGRTLCIPHIHDPKSDRELLAISGADVVVRPSIRATESALRGLLSKIANADFVLSGSLHGAIVACAYGRPFAYWDNGHVDVEFKWLDFAASIGIPCQFARNLGEGREIYAACSPKLRALPLTPILDVCPFAIRPSAFIRALVLDGRLQAPDAHRAVAYLDQLSSGHAATLNVLQALSGSWRAERCTLADVIRRRIGSKKEALKRVVRRCLRLS